MPAPRRTLPVGLPSGSAPQAPTTGAPPAPADPETGTPAATDRAVPDLFEYGATPDVALRPATPSAPGYVEGLIRGTTGQPVFGAGGNWFTRGLGDAGNWIVNEIGKGGDKLVHSRLGTDQGVAITDGLLLGFHARARKLREDEIPVGDARKLGIEELRARHSGAIPLWLEGNFGESLSYGLGHSVPLGGAASIRFGFTSRQSLDWTMQRLLFLPMDRASLSEGDPQLERLRLGPMSASDVARLETGALFRIHGAANFRVDAALGLGAAVPALDDLVRVGANVEAGAYAALTGHFELELQKLEAARARLTLSAQGTAQAGVELRAFAGVQVDHAEVSRLLRGFVDYVARGGKPDAFDRQLSNERERELASGLGGYMKLLVKNVAEGSGLVVVDSLVAKYATAYLEARAGIAIEARFKTTVDFDFGSTELVRLPRADMVPGALRNGASAAQPVQVRAGELARLAYDMAVRGDLRLVQQLALIRSSGVRIQQTTTETSEGTQSSAAFKLPFLEFASTRQAADRVLDRYTPELGRTRTAIAEFNRHYQGIFGRAQDSSAEVRVHAPEAQGQGQLFFGSDDNLSADFVVQNMVEPWTDYGEMKERLAVLDALSNGRLRARAAEALASGQYRDSSKLRSFDPLHQLFAAREYGRTVVHLHIWLGEAGLRQLLSQRPSDAWLYASIGRVTTDHAVAKKLVDDLKVLGAELRAAHAPAEEERAAKHLRDFLRDTKGKLTAYAALATLVAEEHRAVEVRLSAIRDQQTPIRFAYLQDGRTSELLYAAGVSTMAMQQFQRYRPYLDAETRLRLGNLLGEVSLVLNSASPDPFKLRRTMRALELELGRLDAVHERLGAALEADLGVGRAFLSGLPDAAFIQAVLPGSMGAELATLRLQALRLLSAPDPDLTLLRATFKNLLGKMTVYRAIGAVGPMVASTAAMANALHSTDPALTREAVAAVAAVRKALAAGAESGALDRAATTLQAVNGKLLRALGNRADALGSVEAIPTATRAPTAAREAGLPPSSAAARAASGERYVALAGKPSLAPVSYFERTNVVPASYIGTPYESPSLGVVTGSMIHAADLAMASSRPTTLLAVPALSQQNVDRLLGLARATQGAEFLAASEALRFVPGDWCDDPRQSVVELFARGLPASERPRLLELLPAPRRPAFERIFGEIDRSPWDEETTRRQRERLLLDNPRLEEDLRYLAQLFKANPTQLYPALLDLGYLTALDRYQSRATARLEAVLSKLGGDELNKLVGAMSLAQRTRFISLLASSDLRPQTRARIAGGIVDDDFFWRQEEELVAGLVTGMNAGDLRLFFDQLHQDGKLERFLSAGSFWQVLLELLTFGIARLFTHDNAAALRVVAANGFGADELGAEYGARADATHQIKNEVEGVIFDSVLRTAPMDPALRGGLGVVHDLLGSVKYYHFAELPREAQHMLTSMAQGAGKQLVRRLVDVAKQSGSVSDAANEYQRFFAGLSPKNVAASFATGDSDSSAVVVSKTLADGALAGFIEAANDPKNKFITPKLVMGIIGATNQLDAPLSLRAGGKDPHFEQVGYDGLVAHLEFAKQYTGFDYRQLELIYGGLAVAAAAVTFGNTISIAPDWAPTVDGKIQLGANQQQVIAFHETTHVLQQMIYGERLNAFIDQGVAAAGPAGTRNAAYTVTETAFDQASSIHSFQEHWEQQAELIEQSMAMLWARARELGTTDLAAVEAFPGAGRSLYVAGGVIPLSAERWAKMVGFVREFGGAARRSGGRFVFRGTHTPG